MIIRVRSRDGLERVEISETANVHDLREAIAEKLGVPYHDQQLSKDQGLLRASSRSWEFKDMLDDRALLSSLGLSNGALVFLRYSGSREVQPAVKSMGEVRKMDLSTMAARWERIEREKDGGPPALSFDHAAARAFQEYVGAYMAFSAKRGGIMYGTVLEDGTVRVEAIYEPRQHGSPLSLAFEITEAEMALADSLASMMGMSKVGVIFSQSTAEREHELSAEEVVLMAQWQGLCEGGGACGVVSLWEEDDGSTQVHFEAFSVSKQLQRLVADGWVVDAPADGNKIRMRNPKAPDDETPLIVEGKDVGEADVDWFLHTVPIQQHEGHLRTVFPIENRIESGGAKDLKKSLSGPSAMSYQQRLRDFHLLLWLAQQGVLDPETDIPLLVGAVMKNTPIMEGYKLMIDSLAEH